MPRKSVSLFEVLPPSQAPAKSAPSSVSSESAPTPSDSSTKPRQSISMETQKPAPVSESTKSYTTSKDTSSKVRSHSVEGVSVREKSDPFYLVLVCMVVLAVVSALAGYRFGYDRGVREGTSITLEQKSKLDLPVRKVTQQPTSQTTAPPGKTHQASLKPSLPTSIKTLTPEQKRATIPPEELKKYTLQVQTFGRKAIPLAKELVEDMKSKGYDAFYDKNDGAVFVGRLKSVGSSDAKQLRNEILRFNWRSRDFSQSFYRSIPKHLLEP